MSGWNYRVLRFTEPDGQAWYAIHEVFYGEVGAVVNWTERPAVVGSEVCDDLMEVLAKMIEATAQPVLDGKTGEAVEEREVLSDAIQSALQAAVDQGVLEKTADGKLFRPHPTEPGKGSAR